jgi:DNA-binding transcriptional ArsR family regulator
MFALIQQGSLYKILTAQQSGFFLLIIKLLACVLINKFKNICVSNYLHIILCKQSLTYCLPFKMRRDVFQAIADPTRREIISIIANQTINLNTIAESFDVSRSAISQHIKILQECGIVVIDRKGRERYCYVQPQKMKEIDDWLAPFRKLWEQRFDRIDDILEKMKNNN